jgi:putative CRISPR-associated protein (TIGR02620 family)
MKTIIVTRHPPLVEYLHETGLAPEDAEVLDHASPGEIEGAHVIGVLPLHLAALCDRVTVVPLDLPSELRGVELSLAQVRQYAGPARTYTVREVTPE